MAMDEVGRVSVRAIPDTSKFRVDLKKAMSRVEKTAKVNIEAAIKVSASALRDLQARLNKTEITIKAAVSDETLDRIKGQIEDVNAKVDVDAVVDTAGARASLAALSRPRVATIHARVSAKSVVAVGQALAALSGARVVGDTIERLGRSLGNLDRNLPRIAAISSSIASLAGALLAGSSNALVLGASLASIAGAGLALPGIFAGFAVGIGVMIAALKDASTVLADLGPAFTSLQDSISSNFWQRAADPIRNLVNGILPDLRSGLNGISGDMGAMFGSIAANLQSNLGGGVLTAMLDNLAESIRVAKGAIEPLVEGVVSLGLTGSEYLPRLAAWFTDISERFNEFVQIADSNGDLTRWIDTGIAALQDLGRVIGNTGSIFAGLSRAAEAAGGSTLDSLADGLGRIADVVNGPTFQGALTTIFKGAHVAMEGLGSALGPLGDMFVGLAPAIATVLELGGQIVGTLLGGIADALNQPAFATGLTAFFDGILLGVNGLLPVLPVLGEMLGLISTVAGTLGATLGPVLATALGALAPVVTGLLEAVEPLIPMLGQMLMDAIVQLTPLLTVLAVELFPVLAEVMGALVPIIGPLVELLTSVLVPVLQALVPVIQSLVPVIAQVVEYLTTWWAFLQENLIPVIEDLMPIIAFVFGFIVDTISNALSAMRGVMDVVMGLINGDWDQVWNGIKQIVSSVWAQIKNVVQFAITAVWGIISGVLGIIGSLWSNAFNNLVTLAATALVRVRSSVSEGIENVKASFAALPGKIKSALGNLGTLLYSAGTDVVSGMISGIKSMISSLASTAADMAASALNAAKNFLGIASPSKEFMAVGKFSGEGAIKGMERMRRKVAVSAQHMMHVPDAEAYYTADAGTPGREGQPQQVNHIYYPQAAPWSKTVENASSELALAGSI